MSFLNKQLHMLQSKFPNFNNDFMREYNLQDLSVELIKNEYGVFSGYAYITKPLDTTDNKNRYVAGAKLSLFDAIEVEKNYKKNSYVLQLSLE